MWDAWIFVYKWNMKKIWDTWHNDFFFNFKIILKWNWFFYEKAFQSKSETKIWLENHEISSKFTRQIASNWIGSQTRGGASSYLSVNPIKKKYFFKIGLFRNRLENRLKHTMISLSLKQSLKMFHFSCLPSYFFCSFLNLFLLLCYVLFKNLTFSHFISFHTKVQTRNNYRWWWCELKS